MAKQENLPFPVGSTAFGSVTPVSTDLAAYEGKEYWVEDINYASTEITKPHRSGHLRRLRCVRNSAAAAILPKRLVTLKASNHGQVDGYADVDYEGLAYPVDEFLAAAGCPVSDLCYIVIEGPATMITSLGGDATNVFSVHDFVVALTAATSGATTAGRPQRWNTAGTFTATQTTDGTAFNVLANRIGRAMSAKTTANTNADLLVYVGRY